LGLVGILSEKAGVADMGSEMSMSRKGEKWIEGKR